MFKFKGIYMLSGLAMLGFIGMNGVFAMEAEPSSDAAADTTGETGEENSLRQGPSKEEAEKKVEDRAQETYHLSAQQLPDEMLAAIFVSLDPIDLVAASQVSWKWRAIALRIMEDNLVKWGLELPTTPEGIVDKYALVNYEICPALNSSASLNPFLQAMGNGEKGSAKVKFNFNGRDWFIDNTEYNNLKPSIAYANGGLQGKHDSMHYFILGTDNTVEKTEFVNDQTGKRVRCYYKGKGIGYRMGSRLSFKITTFVK